MGFALLAHWLVRQKLNRVSSVQFSYVTMYAPLGINNDARVRPTHLCVIIFVLEMCCDEAHSFNRLLAFWRQLERCCSARLGHRLITGVTWW